MKIDMPSWSVYMLRCGDGSLYTGIAIDVEKRISEHEQGKRGARYLRGRGPLKLVFQKAVGDRSIATRIEQCIKRMPRIDKQNLDRLAAQVDQLVSKFRGIG